MRMSERTLTWQQSRTLPSISSPVRCGVSVGSNGPPPSTTLTLQSPHEPRPPHAEGMNISCSIRLLSSDLPPSTLLCSSSLMVIVHSP